MHISGMHVAQSQAEDEKYGAKVDDPAGEKELESLVFSPPVYRQRYHVVGEIVKKFKAKKVILLTCNKSP